MAHQKLDSLNSTDAPSGDLEPGACPHHYGWLGMTSQEAGRGAQATARLHCAGCKGQWNMPGAMGTLLASQQREMKLMQDRVQAAQAEVRAMHDRLKRIEKLLPAPR